MLDEEVKIVFGVSVELRDILIIPNGTPPGGVPLGKEERDLFGCHFKLRNSNTNVGF